MVDHILEGVGQVVFLTWTLRPLQDMVDTLEEEFPVADIVEADIGETRDRVLWLLDDPRHIPILVGHDHAIALVVLDLLRPDHTGELFGDRSEEHTSELQSRGHLVCRLLLEKKNTTT